MRLVAMLTLWKKIYGKIILYCIFNFTEEKKELGLLAKQHQPNDRYVNQNVIFSSTILYNCKKNQIPI